MRSNWLNSTIIWLAIGVIGVCLLSANAAAASGSLTIKSVTVGPPNVAINQGVTATVTFDTAGLTANLGKNVSITYTSPYGSVTRSATIGGSKVTITGYQTPGTPCDVTYTVDAAGQDSETGTFHVYGAPASFTFTPIGTPFNTTDGTMLVLANGVSKQKFLLTLKDSSNNIVFADTFHLTQKSGAVTSLITDYTIDAQGRIVATMGPTTARTGDLYVTASLNWVNNVTYRLKFIDGQLKITTDKSSGIDISDQSNCTINVSVTLKDGPDPLPNVNVSVKGIWPNGTVDTANTGPYTTNGAGAITINNKFRAGQYNSLNTYNVFIAQIPDLGLLDVAMIKGYTTNVSHLDLHVLPNDPASDGTSYHSVNADGLHFYVLVAHATDFYGNDAEGVPVTFDTYANLDAHGSFTNEITNTYTTPTSELGVASVMTEAMVSPGVIKVNITAGHLTKTIFLYYSAGAPSVIYVRSYPEVIASSDVFNSNITYPVNQSEVVAYVTDDWGHPIGNQMVNFSVPNIDGKIVGTVSPQQGYTDINGMLTGRFYLNYTNGTGEGSVQVVADHGSLTGSVTIKHTENSHLNITTIVNKTRVAVNGTIGVTVRVDGVGWQEGRKPADVIFVMDRSGSMGDAIGYTNYGTNNGGWFPPNYSTYDSLAKNAITGIEYNHTRQTRMIFKFWQQPPVVSYPPANAVCISDDVPTVMRARTSQTIHITMQNTGSYAWDESYTSYLANDYVRFYGRNGTVGSKAFSDQTMKIASNTIVNPGQTVTFTATITAPDVAANTTFYPWYQMSYNPAGVYTSANWFGTRLQKSILVYPNTDPTPTPTPTPAPTPYATIYAPFPTAIKSGETKTVTVTVTNTGDVSFTWPVSTSTYSLGLGSNYGKFGLGSTYYVKDYAASDVIKGNTVSFPLSITGPSVYTNTTWGFTIQMKSGSTGFGQSVTKYIEVYNDSVPLASPLYGDWYYYNLTFKNGSLAKGWAASESQPNNLTGAVVIVPTTDYLPTFGSNGSYPSSTTGCAAAETGVYTIYVNRSDIYGTDEPPFKMFIWDDMKMGQKNDLDAAAKRSAKTFIDNNLTNRYDRAGLVTFGDSATTDMRLAWMNTTTNKTDLKNNIGKINSCGNTNLYDGLHAARMEFINSPSPVEGMSKYIILLTDGYSTSDVTMDLAEAHALADDHVKVFPIGVASAANQVNESELREIANITEGFYQLVDPNNILTAYTNIGKAMEQNITGYNSTLFLRGERAWVDGIRSNNTTYVPGSAFVMTDDDYSTLHQVEPKMTYDGTNYELSWPVDPVRVASTWILNYTLIANLNGPTHPIGNGSQGIFCDYGNGSSIWPEDVLSSIVFVGSGGNTTASDMLNINISLPTQMYDISMPYQVIAWKVNYNSTDTYTQLVEFAPYGTNDFRPIGSGFDGNASASFSTVWDLARMGVGKGKYTIRITATDGLFMAMAERDVQINFQSGQIIIGQPDSREPGY